MEYAPKLPEQNDNVSHNRPLREFVQILLTLLVLSLFVFWCMGLAVDYAVEHMDPDTEAAINKVMVFPGGETAKDKLPQRAQLQELVDSMQQCAGLTAKVQVHLLDREEVNAAVAPGNHMFVFAGLTKQIGSTNGLAFVLAHELGHIRQRDPLRALGRGMVLMSVVALLTGADTGVAEVLIPVNKIGESRYSRARESGADALALQILNCRFGHAGGATEFFDLLKAERGPGFALSHYVASHPGLQARIDAINRGIAAGAMKVEPVQPFTLAAPK
ncbi:M48 family metallopeptidase [Massilia glaciei]|uniref:Peptidase M48 n=1 Tax=Massilia glaciei TaxID=1524097 RepID=A0A2U2HG46_9BURK|nr:M48 family metallopeptidase [Massilia glaciei]PWF43684.1 peptidase M48 [Massilia glaciei]